MGIFRLCVDAAVLVAADCRTETGALNQMEVGRCHPAT